MKKKISIGILLLTVFSAAPLCAHEPGIYQTNPDASPNGGNPASGADRGEIAFENPPIAEDLAELEEPVNDVGETNTQDVALEQTEDLVSQEEPLVPLEKAEEDPVQLTLPEISGGEATTTYDNANDLIEKIAGLPIATQQEILTAAADYYAQIIISNKDAATTYFTKFKKAKDTFMETLSADSAELKGEELEQFNSIFTTLEILELMAERTGANTLQEAVEKNIQFSEMGMLYIAAETSIRTSTYADLYFPMVLAKQTYDDHVENSKKAWGELEKISNRLSEISGQLKLQNYNKAAYAPI